MINDDARQHKLSLPDIIERITICFRSWNKCTSKYKVKVNLTNEIIETSDVEE